MQYAYCSTSTKIRGHRLQYQHIHSLHQWALFIPRQQLGATNSRAKQQARSPSGPVLPLRFCLCQVLLLRCVDRLSWYLLLVQNANITPRKGKRSAERNLAPDPSVTTSGTSGGDRRL